MDKLNICIEYLQSCKCEGMARELIEMAQKKIKASKFRLSTEDNTNIRFINSLQKHILKEKELQNELFRVIDSDTGTKSAFRGLSK